MQKCKLGSWACGVGYGTGGDGWRSTSHLGAGVVVITAVRWRSLKGARVLMLERAFAVLADLVRAEYPEDLTLAEIAATWGDQVSGEQIQALAYLEGAGAGVRYDGSAW